MAAPWLRRWRRLSPLFLASSTGKHIQRSETKTTTRPDVMASVSSLFQSAIKTVGLRVAMALFLGALLAATSPAARAAGETRTWTTDAVALCVQAAAIVLLVYVSVARDLNRGTLRPAPQRRKCQKKEKKQKRRCAAREDSALLRFRAFLSLCLSIFFASVLTVMADLFASFFFLLGSGDISP